LWSECLFKLFAREERDKLRAGLDERLDVLAAKDDARNAADVTSLVPDFV
jgi:hypothetical protein